MTTQQACVDIAAIGAITILAVLLIQLLGDLVFACARRGGE